MKPVDVNSENDSDVRERLYGEHLSIDASTVKYKFKVGDKVRVSKLKNVFEKGYFPNWTLEIFTVSACIPRKPPVYRVKDAQGEEIQGTFYAEELQKVKVSDDELFVINEILDRKKRNGVEQVLVSWRGYPKSMNSWIPASELVKL
jgi:hypothetical protein